MGACVVDQDYQGEIHLNVYNTSSSLSCSISPGEKLVQFLLLPINYSTVIVVSDTELHQLQTERGQGSFGSTGLK